MINILTADERMMLRLASDRVAATTGFGITPYSTQKGYGTIALVQTGSHAYGTNGPQSDLDYTAVVLPSRRYITGLGHWEHWEPGNDGVDIKAMSLKKFIKLAVDGSPNIVEMLFFDAPQLRFVSPQFAQFLTLRTSFLSRDVFKRFSGYAMGQFKKMESGKKQDYMGHKRFEEVQQLGYDSKDASHLMRLLIAGRELAQYGTLTPRLSGDDLAYVLRVKAGAMGLAEIKERALEMAAFNEGLFRAMCPLPETADGATIERILMLVQS